jgi:DNA gyrase subunit A
MVYKMKVYRLPLGTPQARGKAFVNLLPLDEGETITTWMALPEDETLWDQMCVMFATSNGTVRRNKLSDFVNVKANGKIAMKLDEEGDGRLVSVQVCDEDNDVLLATTLGKAIRFPVGDVRVFSGRTSTGVRGIALAKSDEVISMSILGHAELDVEERDAYLRIAAERRRAEAGLEDEEEAAEAASPETEAAVLALAEERVEELAAREQFILSVAADGFGKLTSAYEYRLTKRGGQGIANMDLSRGKGARSSVVAAFAVADGDQLMLVTDGGQLIRVPVAGIRIAGRATRGVTLFRVGEEEKVVSVAHLAENGEDEDEDEEEGDDGAIDGAVETDESEPEEGAPSDENPGADEEG